MIANEARKEGILDKKSNTISGFKVVGLYPLILPEIQARIWMFQDSCIEESFWNTERYRHYRLLGQKCHI